MKKFIVATSLVFLILFGTSQPALADNCGSLSDCYGTIAVAAVVVAAIALAIALAVFLPEILAAAAEEAAAAEAAAARAAINTAIQDAIASGDAATVLEGQVANAVQNAGIDVVGFNVEIGANGAIGEIDIETEKVIIEVTTKNSGKLGQITKLLTNPDINPTGKDVILYAPNYGGTAGQAISNAGGYVARTLEQLIDFLSTY